MDTSSGSDLDLRAVFGLMATVTASAASTGGAYVEMDVTAQPGSRTTIHRHPGQVESFGVLSGSLEVFYEGKWRTVREGESLTVPAGTVHGFQNRTDSPARFTNVHRPALGFEDHLRTLDRLVREGKIRGVNDPRSLVSMSMSAMEHRPDVTVKPPQLVVRSLAAIGRALRFTLDTPRGSSAARSR